MYLTANRTYKAGEAPPLTERHSNRPEDGGEGFYVALWGHTPPAEKNVARAIVGEIGLSDFVTDGSPSGMVTRLPSGEVVAGVHCAYWRKANAIHRWFVEKVQGGIDECQESPVTREQLTALADECRAALALYKSGRKGKAGKAMPPQSGFFFGSTDVDEYWAGDLDDTIKQIDHALTLAKDRPEIHFSYRASW